MGDDDTVNGPREFDRSDLIVLRTQRIHRSRWNPVFDEKHRLDFCSGFDTAPDSHPGSRNRRLNVHPEVDHVCDNLHPPGGSSTLDRLAVATPYGRRVIKAELAIFNQDSDEGCEQALSHCSLSCDEDPLVGPLLVEQIGLMPGEVIGNWEVDY